MSSRVKEALYLAEQEYKNQLYNCSRYKNKKPGSPDYISRHLDRCNNPAAMADLHKKVELMRVEMEHAKSSMAKSASRAAREAPLRARGRIDAAVHKTEAKSKKSLERFFDKGKALFSSAKTKTSAAASSAKRSAQQAAKSTKETAGRLQSPVQVNRQSWLKPRGSGDSHASTAKVKDLLGAVLPPPPPGPARRMSSDSFVPYDSFDSLDQDSLGEKVVAIVGNAPTAASTMSELRTRARSIKTLKELQEFADNPKEDCGTVAVVALFVLLRLRAGGASGGAEWIGGINKVLKRVYSKDGKGLCQKSKYFTTAQLEKLTQLLLGLRGERGAVQKTSKPKSLAPAFFAEKITTLEELLDFANKKPREDCGVVADVAVRVLSHLRATDSHTALGSEWSDAINTVLHRVYNKDIKGPCQESAHYTRAQLEDFTRQLTELRGARVNGANTAKASKASAKAARAAKKSGKSPTKAPAKAPAKAPTPIPVSWSDQKMNLGGSLDHDVGYDYGMDHSPVVYKGRVIG